MYRSQGLTSGKPGSLSIDQLNLRDDSAFRRTECGLAPKEESTSGYVLRRGSAGSLCKELMDRTIVSFWLEKLIPWYPSSTR